MCWPQELAVCRIIGAIIDDTLVSSSTKLSDTAAVRRAWGRDFSGGTYIVRNETCRKVHKPEHEKVSSTVLSTARGLLLRTT